MGWIFKDGRKPQLEIEEPVTRVRTRQAVIDYMKTNNLAPSDLTRRFIRDTFEPEVIDGFDEGVRLGSCYER